MTYLTYVADSDSVSDATYAYLACIADGEANDATIATVAATASDAATDAAAADVDAKRPSATKNSAFLADIRLQADEIMRHFAAWESRFAADPICSRGGAPCT